MLRARMVQTFPVSALAGSVLNVTFGSIDDRLDFAVISDAVAVPDPQRIADEILAAFAELKGTVAPVPAAKKRRRASSRRSR